MYYYRIFVKYIIFSRPVSNWFESTGKASPCGTNWRKLRFSSRVNCSFNMSLQRVKNEPIITGPLVYMSTTVTVPSCEHYKRLVLVLCPRVVSPLMIYRHQLVKSNPRIFLLTNNTKTFELQQQWNKEHRVNKVCDTVTAECRSLAKIPQLWGSRENKCENPSLRHDWASGFLSRSC